MCVIAVKPKGIALPSDEIIEQMWNRNKDGAGFMYAHDDVVNISKGFMELSDLKRALNSLAEQLNSDLTDIPMVLHFRITTHGGTSRENTHPFPITDNDDFLKALDLKAPIGVAHNGVIRTVDDHPTMSDTQIYIKDFLYPLSRMSSEYLVKYKKMISETISSSKLAFLDAGGNLTMIGSFTEKDGIHYSNTYHFPYVPTKSTYNYSYRSRGTSTYYDYLDALDVDDLVKGEKYVIGRAFKTSYKTLHDKVLTYTGTASTYSATFEYDVVTSDGSTLTASTVVAPYVLEPYEAPTPTPTPTETPKKRNFGKHKIGGATNVETAELTQSGNRALYDKSVMPMRYRKLPQGAILIDWLSSYDEKTGTINFDKAQARVGKDTGFVMDSTGDVFYLTKDGKFVLLECVDSVVMVKGTPEVIEGRISFDYVNFIYFDMLSHSLGSGHDTTVYRVPNAEVLTLKESFSSLERYIDAETGELRGDCCGL